jgi:hypothetical protein
MSNTQSDIAFIRHFLARSGTEEGIIALAAFNRMFPLQRAPWEVPAKVPPALDVEGTDG